MRASLPFCNGANGKAGYRNRQLPKRLHMAKALKPLAPFVLEKPLRSAALPGIFGRLRIPKRGCFLMQDMHMRRALRHANEER